MKVSCAQQADPRPSVLAGVTCAGRALASPAGLGRLRGGGVSPLVAGAQAEDLPLGGPGDGALVSRDRRPQPGARRQVPKSAHVGTRKMVNYAWRG